MFCDDKISFVVSQFKKLVGIEQSVNIILRDGSSMPFVFKLIKIVGIGTFGVVAMIENEGKIFALKKVFLDARYCNRELDINLEIEHSNIVYLEGYFIDDGCDEGEFLNMVMEYVIRNIMDIRIEYNYILKIMIEGLEALNFIHNKKICHRDIKPQNILIDENYILKICDFGTAKKIERTGENITYICSRYYRAPELILNRKDYDQRIDIWALGCVIAELYSKRPIFRGKTAEDVLFNILMTVKYNILEIKDINGILKNNKIEMLRNNKQIGIKKYLKKYNVDEKIIEYLTFMLEFDYKKRITAKELLLLIKNNNKIKHL